MEATVCQMGLKLGNDYSHPESMEVLEMTTLQWLAERGEECVGDV